MTHHRSRMIARPEAGGYLLHCRAYLEVQIMSEAEQKDIEQN